VTENAQAERKSVRPNYQRALPSRRHAAAARLSNRWFIEPIEHLRQRYCPFRLMWVERAGDDV
jgi:hypothetical protein